MRERERENGYEYRSHHNMHTIIHIITNVKPKKPKVSLTHNAMKREQKCEVKKGNGMKNNPSATAETKAVRAKSKAQYNNQTTAHTNRKRTVHTTIKN